MAQSSSWQVTHPTRLSEFLAGSRAIVPLVIGAIPLGIIFGALADRSGLSFIGTLAMSAFVFAGSAQFIALGLLATGTALPVIVLTTFVVNLRHLLYSISLVPHLKHLSHFWRLLLGFWLTDENFVVAIARYNQPDRSLHKHWYQLGASLLMYGNWQLCTLIGLLVGHQLPNAADWGLDFAMTVTFIGMVIPYLKTRPMLLTVLITSIGSIWFYSLPYQLGLLISTGIGVCTGVLIERIQSKGMSHE